MTDVQIAPTLSAVFYNLLNNYTVGHQLKKYVCFLNG